jgi:hypothetical protein
MDISNFFRVSFVRILLLFVLFMPLNTFVYAVPKQVEFSDFLGNPSCNMAELYTGAEHVLVCLFTLNSNYPGGINVPNGTKLLLRNNNTTQTNNSDCIFYPNGFYLSCWVWNTLVSNNISGTMDILLDIPGVGQQVMNQLPIQNQLPKLDGSLFTFGQCTKSIVIGIQDLVCNFTLDRERTYYGSRTQANGNWKKDYAFQNLIFDTPVRLRLSNQQAIEIVSNPCTTRKITTTCVFPASSITETGEYGLSGVSFIEEGTGIVSSMNSDFHRGLIVDISETPSSLDLDGDSIPNTDESLGTEDLNQNGKFDKNEINFARFNEAESITNRDTEDCSIIKSASIDKSTQYTLENNLYTTNFATMRFALDLFDCKDSADVQLDFEVDDLNKNFTLVYFSEPQEGAVLISNFSTNDVELQTTTNKPLIAIQSVAYQKLQLNGKNIVRVNYNVVDNSEKDNLKWVNTIVDPVVLLENSATNLGGSYVAPVTIPANNTNNTPNIQKPLLIRTGGV